MRWTQPTTARGRPTRTASPGVAAGRSPSSAARCCQHRRLIRTQLRSLYPCLRLICSLTSKTSSSASCHSTATPDARSTATGTIPRLGRAGTAASTSTASPRTEYRTRSISPPSGNRWTRPRVAVTPDSIGISGKRRGSAPYSSTSRLTGASRRFTTTKDDGSPSFTPAAEWPLRPLQANATRTRGNTTHNPRFGRCGMAVSALWSNTKDLRDRIGTPHAPIQDVVAHDAHSGAS